MDIGESLTRDQMDEYREAHAARLTGGLPRRLDIAGTVSFWLIIISAATGLIWAVTH